MIRVCAWHKKNFGFELKMGEVEPFEDKGETHGMCQECYKIETAEATKEEQFGKERGDQDRPVGRG